MRILLLSLGCVLLTACLVRKGSSDQVSRSSFDEADRSAFIATCEAREDQEDVALIRFVNLAYHWFEVNECDLLFEAMNEVDAVDFGFHTDGGSDELSLTLLRHLKHLRNVTVRSHLLVRADALAELPSLELLILNHNLLTEIGMLEKLTQLKILDLAHNDIADLAPLSGLVKLEELYLDDNEISSLAPLAQLERLQVLAVSQNHLSTLSAVSSLTQLRWIFARNNPLVELNFLAKPGLELAYIRGSLPDGKIGSVEYPSSLITDL